MQLCDKITVYVTVEAVGLLRIARPGLTPSIPQLLVFDPSISCTSLLLDSIMIMLISGSFLAVL